MSQFSRLFQYQQADMKADQFEAEMRKSPNRQKLLSHRNFLMAQQANIKQIESDVLDMSDRMEAIKDDMMRLEKLSQEQAKVDIETIEDLQELRRHIQTTNRLLDSLTRYEQELARMEKDSAAWDQQQKEIRLKSARIKAEFDQLKEVYDREFKEQTEKLEQLHAEAEKLTHNIDPALLKKYKHIKQQVSPPLAVLDNDRCGGCRMSLPSVVLRDIRAGERIVECDNCGRILMVENE